MVSIIFIPERDKQLLCKIVKINIKNKIIKISQMKQQSDYSETIHFEFTYSTVL